MEVHMPRATECTLDKKIVSINEAIRVRDVKRASHQTYPAWRCTECKKPVRPHAAGSQGAAHFEHLKRNSKCSLSDPER
jgi:hypothetical protein